MLQTSAQFNPFSAPRPVHQGVLSAAASGLDAFIVGHGGDLDRVFGRAGIDPEQLRHPTLSLGLPHYCQLLEEAARQTGCEHFGLLYGQQFKPQALGLLGYVGLCSATLEEALVNFAAAFPLHQHSTLIDLKDLGDCYRFDYLVRHPAIGQRRQDAELTLGMALNLMRHVLGPAWAPREVYFEHQCPADASVHREAFAAPVRFGQRCNGLLIPKRDLAGQAMPGRDPVLLMLVKDTLRQLGGSGSTHEVLEQARARLRGSLHLGEPSLAYTAHALQLGETTLQRRLREHGLSFSQLVEQVRQELALRHLREQRLSISELAPLLGYSETSAFSRAFRRWFGVSPRQWRNTTGSVAQGGV
ncbi:AraC family transcriptional regulator [Pseudomonas typographi]|uniref:AraC-like transcriptional regulator QhpR n=1 Tax=Pseudomonas typographi TaxID=2715964 RepID=UPI0016887882|nr:AraC family transcriptional regulator [Pseudomonas typographi]MBD1553888.1 AraC family transcriptional regulator [Pseudomonas typographi]